VFTQCKDSTQVSDKSVTLLTLFPQKTIHVIAGLGGYAETSEKTLSRENGFEQVSSFYPIDLYAEKFSYVLKFFIPILHGQRLTVVVKALPVNLFFHC
jgi:hypothetical protein